MIKIYAPASIGNVTVGFDVLGAAITPIDGALLGDCVTVTPAEHFSLHSSGRFVDQLPRNMKQNIVYQCWQLFCKEMGGKPEPLALQLEKNMPIGSGLGSSACSIVATLVALNQFFKQPFDSTTLLRMMATLEGRLSGSIHYDNVAPCYLGGLQLIIEQAGRISQPIPAFADWLWVVAYPGTKVSTAQARAILPSHYPRQACIHYGRNLAGFVHACYSQQSDLAAQLMHDVIAEPYRLSLLKGFSAARQAVLERGALTCGISGSGPTLFAICDQPEIAQQVALWLQAHYQADQQNKQDLHKKQPDVPQNGHNEQNSPDDRRNRPDFEHTSLEHTSFVHICRLDSAGARQLG